jgi:hypothetical protein
MKLPVVVRVNCPNCRNCLVPFEGSATALAKVVRTKKRMPLRCSDCGFRSTRIITAEQEEQAIKDRDLEARVLADRARIRLDAPIPSKRLPVTEPPRAPRRVRGDQVEGAAKLYHYAVYVKHPWGTDRLVVGVKMRKVQAARDEAWDRVARKRKTVALKIMDCVPMKWTPSGLVETRRRVTVKTGELKNQRKPRSRESVKQRKAPAFVPRSRDDDDAPPAPVKKRRATTKVQYVTADHSRLGRKKSK